MWKGVNVDGKTQYCLTTDTAFKLDASLSLFDIADIDRDGFLDLVFPINNSGSIFVAFNKLNRTYDWADDYCATHNEADLNYLKQAYPTLATYLTSNLLVVKYFVKERRPELLF